MNGDQKKMRCDRGRPGGGEGGGRGGGNPNDHLGLALA
jgi:hypothetical protein